MPGPSNKNKKSDNYKDVIYSIKNETEADVHEIFKSRETGDLCYKAAIGDIRCFLTTGDLPPVVPGTACGLVVGSFAELLLLKNTGALTPGCFYLMNDFQTVYDQPDFDLGVIPKMSVATNTGLLEPLILFAVAVNEFAENVFSTIFQDDTLKYNIDFIVTEAMGVDARGRITERIDDRKNRTDYDHRTVEFKRYEKVLGNGLFDSIEDNMLNSSPFIEVKTFQNDAYSNENHIGDYAIYRDLYGEPFLLSNNIFGEQAAANKTGVWCINNTFGIQTMVNAFGDGFIHNTTKEAFYSNTFVDSSIDNTFGNNNFYNTFGNVIVNNEFKDNNFYNIFKNNIADNIFGSGCRDNSFMNNIINLDFTTVPGPYVTLPYHCTIQVVEGGDIRLFYYDAAFLLADADPIS